MSRDKLRDKLITSVLREAFEKIRDEVKDLLVLPVLSMIRDHTFENNVLPDDVGWIQGWTDPTRFLSYPLIFKGQFVPDRFLKGLNNTIETLKQIGRISPITTAGFSWMKPGCVLPKHIDNNVGYQVAHLGLIVPHSCYLYVNDEPFQESNGKIIIFSDTNEHYAYNKSDENRIILYILYKI